MNKKAVAAGVILGVSLIVVLILMILSSTWNGDEIQSIPYGPGPGGLSFALFEDYGTLMFVLAMLLFGAIIGGAAIARGEKHEEEDDEE